MLDIAKVFTHETNKYKYLSINKIKKNTKTFGILKKKNTRQTYSNATSPISISSLALVFLPFFKQMLCRKFIFHSGLLQVGIKKSKK